jgi:cell division protein FtsA
MEGTIITGSKTALSNLVRCIERAGLSINGVFLQTLATSSIALSKDEKNIGIVLADVGAGQITLSIYEHGALAATGVIPIGGEYITNDIAIGLKTKSEVAEEVKLSHGTALVDEALEDEVFTVPRIGSDVENEFNQVDLAHIIEPRMLEIFELIRQEVKRNGFIESPGGYVLTGGVMSMPGALELAREVFQNSIRVATPDYIGVREPQFTASVGMIKYALENTRQRELEVAATAVSAKNNSSNQRDRVQEPAEKASMKEKVKNWFKEFI